MKGPCNAPYFGTLSETPTARHYRPEWLHGTPLKMARTIYEEHSSTVPALSMPWKRRAAPARSFWSTAEAKVRTSEGVGFLIYLGQGVSYSENEVLDRAPSTNTSGRAIERDRSEWHRDKPHPVVPTRPCGARRGGLLIRSYSFGRRLRTRG